MTMESFVNAPVASRETLRTAAPVPAPAVRRATLPSLRRILIADDEHLAAACLVRSLRQLGYTTIGPARDGSHAVQLAFSTYPDLVLMDVRMATDRDGIEAAAALYSEMGIPVVMVSAFSDPEQVAGAGAAGVFGYLVKPATTEQLRAALEIAWARYTQLLNAERENTTLRRRLDERRTIEAAKWSLVERFSLSEAQAMEQMRRSAGESGRALIDLAIEILSD